MLRKLLLIIVFFFLILFVLPRRNVWAVDFATKYDVYYTIYPSGVTDVKQNITLTNLVTDYYAQNFSLTIASEKISQVTAWDSGGNIPPQINKNNGQTTITLPFNVKVVGKDKPLYFTLEYESRDIALQKGKIWEIIIPGINQTPDLKTYTIHLSVPASFGTAAYFSPLPQEGGVWTMAQLKDGGITAAFGDFQNFSFSLEYNIENKSAGKEIQEITLPPDTALQKVILTRLSELPNNVVLDTDGNWLARYFLKPKEKKHIFAEGNVLLFAKPQEAFARDLSPQERQLYTQTQPFWEQTPQIIKLAQTLSTPQDIYNWVVTHLTYDYARIEPGIQRLGAEEAFKNPTTAVCMEFSDLFIALARAKKIPAREIHGFAYTSNSHLQPLSLLSDVLHAWPEYYDESSRQWIQVDPTWGNTTHGIDYFHQLDFNHIAFAILGTKSNYPYPAGSFKTEEEGKSVFVNFSDENIIPPSPQYKIEFVDKTFTGLGFSVPGNIMVRNTGNTRVQLDNVSVTAGVPVNLKTTGAVMIPPFGYVELPYSVIPPFTFVPQSVELDTIINGQVYKTDILVIPFYQTWWGIIVVLIFFSGVLLLFKTYVKQRS